MRRRAPIAVDGHEPLLLDADTAKWMADLSAFIRTRAGTRRVLAWRTAVTVRAERGPDSSERFLFHRTYHSQEAHILRDRWEIERLGWTYRTYRRHAITLESRPACPGSRRVPLSWRT